MFNIFKRKPTFTLERFDDGRFAIVEKGSTAPVKTYTRKRDAVRGAERMGITLTEGMGG